MHDLPRIWYEDDFEVSIENVPADWKIDDDHNHAEQKEAEES